MRHSCQPGHAATIVAFEGRLNTASTPELHDQLRGAVRDGGSRLVLDLSGVTYVDSMALSVFVSALKLARKEGGNLVLLRPTPPVRSLLEVTRLDRIFHIFKDEESAVAVFEEEE